eukprot:c8777_g1_i1.p1 GENE.c8777_g1_i1~~c8777_g1_i1.p1  ORF type:complete len:535 (+),score=195.84 c8777_g1_i1:38-1642(+)
MSVHKGQLKKPATLSLSHPFRYYELDQSGVLTWYKAEGEKPLGSLSGFTGVQALPQGKVFGFKLVCDGKTHTFHAKSQEESDKWVAQLKDFVSLQVPQSVTPKHTRIFSRVALDEVDSGLLAVEQPKISEEDWTKFSEMFDGKDSNDLSMEEFQVALTLLQPPKPVVDTTPQPILRPTVFRQYAAIYTLLDAEQKNSVSAEELAKKLRIPPSKACVMIASADLDGNKTLDFSEFVKFVVKRDQTATALELKNINFDLEKIPDSDVQRYQMLFDLLSNCEESVLSPTVMSALKMDNYRKASIELVPEDVAMRFEEFVEEIVLWDQALTTMLLEQKVTLDQLIENVSADVQMPQETETTYNKLVDPETGIVSTVSLLRNLQSIVHDSGSTRKMIDDLFVVYSTSGSESLSLEQFSKLLVKYPNSLFEMTLTIEIENKLAAQDDTDEVVNSPELLEEYKRLFDILDADHSGTVDKSEVTSAITKASTSVEVIYSLLEAVGSKPGQQLTLTQFISVMNQIEGGGDLELVRSLITDCAK